MSLKLINTGGNGGFFLRNTGGNGSLTITSSPQLITEGLTLRLDASKAESYGGSGTTWIDIAGTEQNITLIGSPTFTSGLPSYFTFDGSTQRGSGTGAVLSSTSYTKSIWFYVNSYQDNNLISSADGGHFMYMYSENKIYSGHSNWPSYIAYPSTGTISLNTWYNVTLTFNTTDGMTLYINGDQDSTYTANKAAYSGDSSVNIAAFGTGNFFNGRISKVYCYNRSLTPAEVLQNYNVDKSQFGL